MVIRVNPSTAVSAAVSYIEAGYDASWLEVQVFAEVTMPDVYQVDVVTPTDLVTLDFTKSLADTTSGFAELITRAFTKAAVDTITMVDTVDIEYWIEKALADTQALTDAASKAFSKALTDTTAGFVDNLSYGFTKALSDTTPGFTDSQVLAFTKVEEDSVELVDTVDLEYWIEKLLEDTQSLTDNTTKAFAKALADTSSGFVDAVAFAYTKALTDTTSGFADVTTTSVDKGLSDSVTMVDTADLEYSIVKALADLTTFADSTISSVDKALTDSTTLADALGHELGKALTDTLSSPTDAISTLSLAKALDETLTTADNAVTTLIFIRDVAETLTASDSSVLANSLEKSETLAATDAQIASVVKGLSEALNLIDNMDGDIEYDIIKLVGELLVTSDGQVIDFATQSSDNVLTSSSGVLVQQDYCDITYFATDYVGTSRTFT